MKRILILFLICLMLAPVYGCGGGGGRPQGSGELKTENPRAKRYDQDAADMDNFQPDQAETQQE
jgi:hypothetical protein